MRDSLFYVKAAVEIQLQWSLLLASFRNWRVTRFVKPLHQLMNFWFFSSKTVRIRRLHYCAVFISSRCIQNIYLLVKMVLKLYYDLVSPPARAVYLIIKTLNIPVELVELRIIKGDIKSKKYLKVGPFIFSN